MERLASTGLLLLVFHELDVILGYILVLVQQELLNLVANVALDDDLLAAAGDLGDRCSGGELLAEILCYLLAQKE